MTINLLSISLSFFLNFFFLALMMIGLTFSVPKKEEIRITLLEPSTFEVVKPEMANQEKIREEIVNNPVEPLALQREISPAKEKLKEKTIKAPAEKRNTFSEKSEEALLKERLLALKKSADLKRDLKEEEEFLKKRLYSLQAKPIKREGVFSEGSQSVAGGKESLTGGPREEIQQGTTLSNLPDEYLLLIKRKLQTHFEVPIYLKNRGNLSALVEIQVSPSGEIFKVSFLKKAEEEAFNRAVEKCLKAVNPLPIEKNITLRIEFKAQGITMVK